MRAVIDFARRVCFSDNGRRLAADAEPLGPDPMNGVAKQPKKKGAATTRGKTA
jgi:hypothetical protein